MVVKGGMWLSRVECGCQGLNVVVKGGMWLSRVECVVICNQITK